MKEPILLGKFEPIYGRKLNAILESENIEAHMAEKNTKSVNLVFCYKKTYTIWLAKNQKGKPGIFLKIASYS